MKASSAQQGLAAPENYPCLLSSDVRVGAGQHQRNNAVLKVLLQKAKKLPCLNYIKSVNMEDNLTLFPEHLSLTQHLPLFDLVLWYMNFLIYFLMCFRA